MESLNKKGFKPSEIALSKGLRASTSGKTLWVGKTFETPRNGIKLKKFFFSLPSTPSESRKQNEANRRKAFWPHKMLLIFSYDFIFSSLWKKRKKKLILRPTSKASVEGSRTSLNCFIFPFCLGSGFCVCLALLLLFVDNPFNPLRRRNVSKSQFKNLKLPFRAKSQVAVLDWSATLETTHLEAKRNCLRNFRLLLYRNHKSPFQHDGKNPKSAARERRQKK